MGLSSVKLDGEGRKLGTTSEFCSWQRKTKKCCVTIGRSQELGSAQWLLADNATNKQMEIYQVFPQIVCSGNPSSFPSGRVLWKFLKFFLRSCALEIPKFSHSTCAVEIPQVFSPSVCSGNSSSFPSGPVLWKFLKFSLRLCALGVPQVFPQVVCSGNSSSFPSGRVLWKFLKFSLRSCFLEIRQVFPQVVCSGNSSNFPSGRVLLHH
jgi:hypothetical protein